MSDPSPEGRQSAEDWPPSPSWQEVLSVALPAETAVHSRARLQLGPEPRNVKVARDFVAEHVPDVPAQTRDTLLLLTSELVTNAVVHARTEIEVAVAVTDEDVLVAVHDLDLGRREQRSYERDGGRGLLMVEAMSRAHGLTVHRGGGKTSWFRLLRRTPVEGSGQAQDGERA